MGRVKGSYEGWRSTQGASNSRMLLLFQILRDKRRGHGRESSTGAVTQRKAATAGVGETHHSQAEGSRENRGPISLSSCLPIPSWYFQLGARSYGQLTDGCEVVSLWGHRAGQRTADKNPARGSRSAGAGGKQRLTKGKHNQ